MNAKKVIVKGAREHNLKGINVEIPREQLVIITGLHLVCGGPTALRRIPLSLRTPILGTDAEA
jgi:excinuclease UvrABC ATPase subunit